MDVFHQLQSDRLVVCDLGFSNVDQLKGRVTSVAVCERAGCEPCNGEVF